MRFALDVGYSDNSGGNSIHLAGSLEGLRGIRGRRGHCTSFTFLFFSSLSDNSIFYLWPTPVPSRRPLTVTTIIRGSKGIEDMKQHPNDNKNHSTQIRYNIPPTIQQTDDLDNPGFVIEPQLPKLLSI